jgi:heme/copper-type cytochrome/quinol oxidase subunit 2
MYKLVSKYTLTSITFYAIINISKRKEGNQMKKLIVTMILTILLVTCIAYANAEQYSTLFKVIDLDWENDLVIFVDCVGFEWVWEGIEDIEIGDIFSAIMDTHETEEIFDDKIIDIKYQRLDMLLTR